MHSLLYTVIGFAAMALAYPATEEMALLEKTALINEAAMLAELKVETNEFINKYNSTIEFQELQRWILSGDAPTSGCKRASMIFARGTFEPPGDNFMGVIVGLPFYNMLKTVLGSETIDAAGVDYNNGVAGYMIGGDGPGSKKMAQIIRDKAAECPSTKIIASGYSQGAQLAHNALNELGGGGGFFGGSGGSATISNRIAAVVVFGDPNKGRKITGIDSSKIFTNCLEGDPICAGLPIPLGPHLNYGFSSKEMRQCVDFIKARV